MSFADGTGEKSEGKRAVRGLFFGSNRPKGSGFEARNRDFQGVLFTDKYMGSVAHVVDCVLLARKPLLREPELLGKGGGGGGWYGPGTCLTDCTGTAAAEIDLAQVGHMSLCVAGSYSSAKRVGTGLMRLPKHEEASRMAQGVWAQRRRPVSWGGSSTAGSGAGDGRGEGKRDGRIRSGFRMGDERTGTRKKPLKRGLMSALGSWPQLPLLPWDIGKPLPTFGD